LVTSLLSPFKEDWSAKRLPSITTPSAGTFSPACRKTMSPTTISPMGIFIMEPFLLTRHIVFEDSSCNCSKANSLPYSDKVETKVAKKIAIAIPTDSYQLKLRNMKIRLIQSAASNILIIGSPKFEINCLKKLFFFTASNVLSPYLSLDSSTSCVFRPCISFSDLVTDIICQKRLPM